jgi:hypothetical protein
MRFRTKVAIFLAAVVLSLAGFNLLVSPAAVDLLKLGKEAAYGQASNSSSHAYAHYTITVEG